MMWAPPHFASEQLLHVGGSSVEEVLQVFELLSGKPFFVALEQEIGDLLIETHFVEWPRKREVLGIEHLLHFFRSPPEEILQVFELLRTEPFLVALDQEIGDLLKRRHRFEMTAGFPSGLLP